MTSAIILGDPHVGKGVSLGKNNVGVHLNSRIVDQINLLDWTLDKAVECHADHIIITGDVFEDPKPHPALITVFVAWLKKCQVFDVQVHIIMGNHDLLRSGNLLTSPLDIISEIDLDNVTVYKDINTIFIGPTAFTLVPFRDRKFFSSSSGADALNIIQESLVYELAGIPNTYKKIVVGHLAIEGAIPVGDEIDDLVNELFCPVSMFHGYDSVWMGHVHKPQVVHKSNPRVAHIGSMDISNFGETDHKKQIVIVDCANGTWQIEDLPTRPLKKVAITIPKDTVDSTAYVLEELKKNKEWDRSIVRVEVSLATPELKSINKSMIEKYLISHGAFNVTGVTESKKIALIKRDTSNTIDTKMDVPAAIKTYAQTYVEEKNRSDFIEVAMDIVATLKSEAKE